MWENSEVSQSERWGCSEVRICEKGGEGPQENCKVRTMGE